MLARRQYGHSKPPAVWKPQLELDAQCWLTCLVALVLYCSTRDWTTCVVSFLESSSFSFFIWIVLQTVVAVIIVNSSAEFTRLACLHIASKFKQRNQAKKFRHYRSSFQSQKVSVPCSLYIFFSKFHSIHQHNFLIFTISSKYEWWKFMLASKMRQKAWITTSQGC